MQAAQAGSSEETAEERAMCARHPVRTCVRQADADGRSEGRTTTRRYHRWVERRCRAPRDRDERGKRTTTIETSDVMTLLAYVTPTLRDFHGWRVSELVMLAIFPIRRAGRATSILRDSRAMATSLPSSMLWEKASRTRAAYARAVYPCSH